jgi:hypothetical protein
MFSPGDRVILINSKGRSAQVGATATVKAYNSPPWMNGPAVTIEWDRTNPLCSSQSDGGYEAAAFMLESSDRMCDPDFSLDEIHEAQAMLR